MFNFIICGDNQLLMKLSQYCLILFMAVFTVNSRAQVNISNSFYDIENVSFHTSDSVTVFGTFYKRDKQFPTILLFHQGGSNATAEYRTIIPMLAEHNLNILAIDQRVGGQIYGSYNKTIVDITTNTYGYCDAYPDLEAALDYVIQNAYNGKKILWGSSYSASLVIKLANNRPDDVSGVLAFSPASGEQLKDCLPNPYFETIKVPLLILRPDREAQFESVQEQLKLAQSFGHQTYVAKNGLHGSSMLVKERVQKDTSENWNIVNTFINSITNN